VFRGRSLEFQNPEAGKTVCHCSIDGERIESVDSFSRYVGADAQWGDLDGVERVFGDGDLFQAKRED